jgi:hypothetical protein
MAWVMCAIFLLSGGCQNVTQRDLQRLIRQPVCPVCRATSIDECHCFHVVEGAGYCQTSWVSLDPALSVGPGKRGGLQNDREIPVEELPTPQALLPSQGADGPRSTGEFRNVTDGAEPVMQTVSHWRFSAPSPPGGNCQGVSRHFADKEPLSDQE